jgi:hypothetical protein
MVGDVPLARLYGMAVGVEIEFKMADREMSLEWLALLLNCAVAVD